MKKYPDMCGEGNASLLALRLAEEAFFGQDVLVRCTPKGARGRPSLPVRELADLKVVLFGQCPTCWCNVEKFEVVWNSTLDKLGQAKRQTKQIITFPLPLLTFALLHLYSH